MGFNEVKWWCYILIDINPQLNHVTPIFSKMVAAMGMILPSPTGRMQGKARRKKMVDSPLNYSYITHESWQVN